PQWDTHEFSKSVRALLGVDSGWDWLSPDQPIQLTHALKVTSGVSGREPCQQIVNAYYATRQPSGKYNGCAAYGDYRELLEKQKDVDAVVVCTTDNLHAAVSAAAMKGRKHGCCQKPPTGHLATPICPLCGGVGPTSAAARWETWVLTASIPSFAC